MELLSSTSDLNTLPDSHLRALVESAAKVLTDSATDDLDPSLMTQGARASAQEIVPLLVQDHENITVARVQQALEEPDTARTLSIKVLEELRRFPELARAIDDAYNQRQKSMGAETVLLAGALLVLAVKIKEIDFHGGKITFYQCAAELKSFLANLVTGMR